MTTTNEHTELEELLQAIRNQLGDDFDPSDCFYEQGLLYRAAAMLEAQRPALRPLTEEQLRKMWEDATNLWQSCIAERNPMLRFARAIEAAHGIKGDA